MENNIYVHINYKSKWGFLFCFWLSFFLHLPACFLVGAHSANVIFSITYNSLKIHLRITYTHDFFRAEHSFHEPEKRCCRGYGCFVCCFFFFLEFLICALNAHWKVFPFESFIIKVYWQLNEAFIFIFLSFFYVKDHITIMYHLFHRKKMKKKRKKKQASFVVETMPYAMHVTIFFFNALTDFIIYLFTYLHGSIISIWSIHYQQYKTQKKKKYEIPNLKAFFFFETKVIDFEMEILTYWLRNKIKTTATMRWSTKGISPKNWFYFSPWKFYNYYVNEIK